MFLIMPSTKIAQMVLLCRKGGGRVLDKIYLQMKSPEPLVQNQNNFTEMVLMLPFMLGLHYVPGSHGNQKRSSPWRFESFLSLCSSSVKSPYVYSRSVKVCRDSGSPARYGLSRMVLRFLPACHVLLGPLTFCYVAINFCYVYRVLSRFSTMKRGR